MMSDIPEQVQYWSVYLLRCADDTLYTGIAKDIQARVAGHNQGVGAKYTRGRTPVDLVYVERVGSRSAALRREYAIKQLSRSRKLQMIDRYRRLQGLAD